MLTPYPLQTLGDAGTDNSATYGSTDGQLVTPSDDDRKRALLSDIGLLVGAVSALMFVWGFLGGSRR